MPRRATETEEEYNIRMTERRVKKEMVRKTVKRMKIPLTDIERALVDSKGSLAKAAQQLGVPRPALKRKVMNTPSLVLVMDNIREERIDIVESKVFEQAEDGYFPAMNLILRTLGKERGYSERTTTEHEIGDNAQKSSAALIEAMRRGTATPPKELEDKKPIEIEIKEYEWKEKED